MNNVYSIDNFKEYISISLSTMTVKEYGYALKNYFDFLNKEPQEIKKEDLLKYVSSMHKRGISASLINLRLAGVKKYYKYLVSFEVFEKPRFIDLFYDIDLPKITQRK